MDLLNQSQSNHDSEMQKRMLHILEGAKISSNNWKIAVEFFDFSKEMNLELLENVQFEEVSLDYPFNNLSYEMVSEWEDCNEYSDRYILFFDAIGGNTVYECFTYRNFFYQYDCEEKESIVPKLVHAFSRKYPLEYVQAKIAALIAGERIQYSFSQILSLMEIAKIYPIDFYRGVKYCCKRKNTNAEIRLYAMALAYSEPLIEPVTADEKEMELYQKEAVSYIMKQVSEQDLSKNERFAFLLSACFMAMNHEEKCRELIMNCIKKREIEFCIAILKTVPDTYFEKNVNMLLELLQMDCQPSLTCQYIKYAVCGFGLRYLDTIPGNVKVFLEMAAKKYPEQFIEAMRSTDVLGTSMYYYPKVMVCTYYENMYHMLKQMNPESIEIYKVDFEAEILQLAAESEKDSTKQYKEEVYQYLYGERDSSVLEPYFEELQADCTCYEKNEDIIKSCMKYHDSFRKHYLALKAIQYPKIVKNMITSQKNLMQSIEELIQIFLSEGVQMPYRFGVYELIYGDHTSKKRKEKIEIQIAKTMFDLSSNFDKEYENYCKKGGVFAKKAYLRYLEFLCDDKKQKERILAMCGDSSKEVRKFAVEISSNHKEYEEDIAALLKSKKQAIRESAVDIFTIWGAENYKDILLAAAQNEKSTKLADKICNLINTPITGETGKDNKISSAKLVQNLNHGSRNKKILWLYETPNSVVHFKDGKEAEQEYMEAILLCYANMEVPGVNQNAAALASDLKQEELEKYVADIFSKWIDKGAETKQKWILYVASIHGGHNMIEALMYYIKEWAENLRGAIAAEAVRALALNGSSEALIHVENMAHKFKKKQIKNAAIQALDNAAEELGITSEELGDRIVPDLGFNENMERIFDYGSRKFKVYLTPTLELEVFDEDNKKRKTLPAPAKKDEEELAKQSNAEFKQMKKQLKNVSSFQKSRLETALLADRRWTVDAWKTLFVKNPVMHSFAIGLIWAAYEENKLVQTFRYMEDGSFNTSKEDEYILSENSTIGLVHPIDLTKEELTAWKEQLSDYEIIQPIEQLERKVYYISEDEIGTVDLKRFYGRKINAFTLLGRMTKFGWDKGAILDAGRFYIFYREDVVGRIKRDNKSIQLIGNAAELHFSGMYVGWDDSDVEIKNLRFYVPGTMKHGSYGYDEADDNKAIKLDKINPRYFSEIVNQLELIFKGIE